MKASGRISRVPMISIAIFCIIGMGFSIYAYHVETTAHSDPSYRALCDISETMSCSKVFSSRYGKGFGLIDRVLEKDHVLNQPNSVFGMLFYLLNALLAFNTHPSVALLQLLVSVLGTVGCVYLAFILIFILEDLCLVCVSTYIINAVILLAAIYKYRAVQIANYRQSDRSSSNSKKRR